RLRPRSSLVESVIGLDYVDLMKVELRLAAISLGRSARRRNAHNEPRSLLRHALHRDRPAHRLREMLDNRQPQTGAPEFAGASFVHAIESLKDSRLVGFRYAYAAVLDL